MMDSDELGLMTAAVADREGCRNWVRLGGDKTEMGELDRNRKSVSYCKTRMDVGFAGDLNLNWTIRQRNSSVRLFIRRNISMAKQNYTQKYFSIML